MRIINTKTTISLAIVGMFFTAAVAQADYGYSDVVPQDKIDLCVAAIAEKADYDEANYVRHEVSSKPRATIGHTLSINTLVFDENEGQLIREYRTLCAVSNRAEPVAFRIREAK